MESHSLLAGTKDHHSARCRFPHGDDAEVITPTDASETKGPIRKGRATEALGVADLLALRWFGWLFVYAFALVCFSICRCLALPALVEMYGSPQAYTLGFELAALGLGFMEDFVCTTYFAFSLWLFDVVKRRAVGRFEQKQGNAVRAVANATTFAVSWLSFIVVAAPFAADVLLIVNRNMRFTLDLLAAVIKERHHLNAAPISPTEIQRGYVAAAILTSVATLFALARTRIKRADLSGWNPTQLLVDPVRLRTRRARGAKYVELKLEEGSDGSTSDSSTEDEDAGKVTTESDARDVQNLVYRHTIRFMVAFVGLAVVPALVVAIRSECSPLVAYSALNASLNELFAHALQPAPTEATFTTVKGGQPWVEAFIHPTEEHELFGNDTLYRRTTGFQGELAFDVSVQSDNPPNVLVIGVESFRFQDSRYLVGDTDPSNLFKGANMTITPNFDKWAKRGVALRNLWSSTPTSRSLESLLFAQVPYHSTVKTGITGGRKGTKLSGLPQLFKAKGYETFFTTGCLTRFENWNVFLPSHGFDVVLEASEMARLAKSRLGIKHGDWYGAARRGFNWGVHDDINLQLLGDMLLEKTRRQRKKTANGEREKPLFITHYTISSHAPFKARPTWYAKSKKPDFSALYEGEKHAKDIRNYLEMRHFTDMELGKFMDRMEKEGVLNDTIVVIVGDHGQAPEADVTNTHEESVTRVAGAIIAEGRLGGAAGLVIEDAVEHYDMLNTLADITGVPEGGFVQNGVGRSLKRKVQFGRRPVFSNDPSRKMAIVRGHQRLRYDQVTATLMLHDTETDHNMTVDVFPGLSDQEQEEWKGWRDDGRRIAAYYRKRWDENCLVAVNCTGGRSIDREHA